MKKLLSILLFLIPVLAFTQVTTSPALPTANDEITITFDATGTPLAGYTGDIYAHTGATVNGERWQNVIGDWAQNSVNPKLTRDNTNANLYSFVITPSVYTFYSIDISENITELSFVFRNSEASAQTSPDIFIPIYAAGLNVAFTSPADQSAYNLNDVITITAESSITADLELQVDGVSIQTTTNTTSISTSYTLTTSGTQTLKAIASTGSETKETTISVYVKTTTQTATQPTGLKYGINKNPNNSVTFLLKAPNKTDVLILGDFSNWAINSDYLMFKDGDDFWLTVPDLDINTEYAYQYLIDYDIKIADPYSEKILDPWNDQYIKDGNYPNLKDYPTDLTTGFVSTFIIDEPEYTWNVTNFIKPAQDNLIIYELHIRDFTESDSFNEALTHLDYLESLGINAIELMPINEFEGADSWGYNPALYMALDKAYGTKNDFKNFVDECHKRGIAVLADVVFNHSYSQSPLLQMYWNSVDNKPAADSPWYNEEHNLVDNTSAHWGYDFNHESPHTTDFFNDVLSYWMNEYKIDGFRFDFTKGMSNTIYSGSNNWASTYDQDRIDILKNYADHVWSNDPTNKPYVIFEHLSDNSEETVLANYGIMLWGNMNHAYAENTMGWSGSEDISWISYQQRGWDNANVVGYMESHDEERLMYKNLQSGNSSGDYNVKDLNTALARQELAGLFFFTIPGPKMIWQFGELGYDVNIDFNDRVGRKPIHWEYFEDANRKKIYDTWATLIEFKKEQPVFNTNDYTLNVGGLTKSIVLRHASMDVVIVGNFDVTNKSIAPQFTKTGTWYEYFTGTEKNVTNTSESIELNPGEYRLYSTVDLSNTDSDEDGVLDSIDLCLNTPTGEAVDANGCSDGQLDDDNDGVQNSDDLCPDTPALETVDVNGCGDSQLDDDNDGVMNNIDLCLNTPSGETVNIDGCWTGELDDDNDGVQNSLDLCPDTPALESVDITGCGDSHLDDDNDGVMNNIDLCLNTPTGETVDIDGCWTGELDDDNDGVQNSIDLCVNTTPGVMVDATGCFTLPSDNFDIEATSETCPDEDNGQLLIAANEIYNYIVTINGIETDGVTIITRDDESFTNTKLLENLVPGNYTICILVDGEVYEQCFLIEVKESDEIGGKISVTSGKATVEIEAGTAPFTILVNRTETFETYSSVFDIDVKHGDLIEVKTAKSCEGTYSKTIELLDGIVAYPNPTKGSFEIALPVSQKEVTIELYTIHSQLISVKTYPVIYGKVQLNIENKPTGLYIAKIQLDSPITLKIVKE